MATAAVAVLPNPDLMASPVNLKEPYDSDSTISSLDSVDSTTQNTLESLPNMANTPIKNPNMDLNTVKSSPETVTEGTQTSATTTIATPVAEPFNMWKLFVVLLGIGLMFAGRFNIPNNDVEVYTDNVLDWLQPFNDWLLDDANSIARRIMLFCCATNMDITFFATVFYWLRYNKTGRLPFCIFAFYIIRTVVQQFSFQPIPKGYYWDSPGFPSFVAPYGRTTDFFFSGHSGFLVLMSNEWGKLGFKKVQRFMQVMLVYTIFILLICQGHYSIDIFTGVFFADYIFTKVDMNKEAIDKWFIDLSKFLTKSYNKVFGKKAEKKLE